ncbi:MULTISPECIES: hypothetical protein [Sphingobacterium]|uniref:hypothetical protein n=1 Tax=Sphingobacterium TaxID=28453 RepID=UPI00104AC6CE|nr:MULTISPECIES: hypothetical protein [Sphingobacterium]MCW2264001.1 hypothetical protein [Sphingobacterium kitahiroshimense]NJI73270.1 hypothetical protein [Sphingobacterium sp. B16(2022)]TCR15014.1 hypothetical protein EDF67_1011121 [Sphingobacterium sp. JUb78]
MMINRRFFKFFSIWCLLAIGTNPADAQQVSDENFNYPISTPTYTKGNGPLLLFDEAHNNASTLKGAYAAFSKLLRDDGYKVVSNTEKISWELLKKAKIYVTVNAMYDLEDWNLPARSAFSTKEMDELSTWVAAGGSLFLVTDHMPCGASVHDLAGRFGINIINGFALRKDGLPEVFSKERKTLISNQITSSPGEEIDSIMCWGGTGFIVPSHAHVISALGDDYNIYLPSNVSQIKRPLPDTIPYISGRGLVNGAYLKYGKGRVVIFGDGAPFSAQLQGIKSEKRGMNHPSATQNAQFLLNIIHWLDCKF